MRSLWRYIRFIFRRKHQRVLVLPTRRSELVALAETAVKAVDALGYKLQDAWDEGLLRQENRAGHPACDAHKHLAFHASRVRDELSLEASREIAPMLRDMEELL